MQRPSFRRLGIAFYSGRRRAAPVGRLVRASSAIFAAVVFFFPTMAASASPVPTVATPTVDWSGYGLAGSGFTGVTGTFNVPAPLQSASCLEETAIWVGVDGLDNHDLLQAGIAETNFAPTMTPTLLPYTPSSGFPGVMCLARAQVYAWWEDLPSAPVRVDLPVRVGDNVTVSIFKMSSGWWALAVLDLTDKQSFLLAQPYAGPRPRWNGSSRHLKSSASSRETRSPSARCTSAASGRRVSCATSSGSALVRALPSRLARTPWPVPNGSCVRASTSI